MSEKWHAGYWGPSKEQEAKQRKKKEKRMTERMIANQKRKSDNVIVPGLLPKHFESASEHVVSAQPRLMEQTYLGGGRSESRVSRARLRQKCRVHH